MNHSNPIYYFSDEQGIKIPDDDDGGFNDNYKPKHPNFSSHFDHGKFEGIDKYENSIPPPSSNNAYQRPEIHDYSQNNYNNKGVGGHRPNSIPLPTNTNAYQRPDVPNSSQSHYLDKVGDGYRPSSITYPPNNNEHQRPDGPDYSQNINYSQGTPGDRRTNNRGSNTKKPLTIGLDVYPVLNHVKNAYAQYSNRESGSVDENLHEVLLKLNLFSRKPELRGGNRRKDGGEDESTISLGPFSYNVNGYGLYL